MQVLHFNLFDVDKGDNQISESWPLFALANFIGPLNATRELFAAQFWLAAITEGLAK